MMAIENIVNLYAYGFAIAAILAVVLLVAAARRLAEYEKEAEAEPDHFE